MQEEFVQKTAEKVNYLDRVALKRDERDKLRSNMPLSPEDVKRYYALLHNSLTEKAKQEKRDPNQLLDKTGNRLLWIVAQYIETDTDLQQELGEILDASYFADIRQTNRKYKVEWINKAHKKLAYYFLVLKSGAAAYAPVSGKITHIDYELGALDRFKEVASKGMYRDFQNIFHELLHREQHRSKENSLHKQILAELLLVIFNQSLIFALINTFSGGNIESSMAGGVLAALTTSLFLHSKLKEENLFLETHAHLMDASMTQPTHVKKVLQSRIGKDTPYKYTSPNQEQLFVEVGNGIKVLRALGVDHLELAKIISSKVPIEGLKTLMNKLITERDLSQEDIKNLTEIYDLNNEIRGLKIQSFAQTVLLNIVDSLKSKKT